LLEISISTARLQTINFIFKSFLIQHRSKQLCNVWLLLVQVFETEQYSKDSWAALAAFP
jgi:hypothetical protein